MHPLIADNLAAIRALAREFGVARLEVFGSVRTPGWDPERSDVDSLVAYLPDYDSGPWHGRFLELQRSLASLLGLDVELVDVWAFRNRWFPREAARTRRPLSDASEYAQAA
ncbi:MAG TPA: nucleotidyltransferase domain-containing protein [Thermomicrobiales bacterium]|nr:nucleotidyltransferase domain-containing protein [Thermomicrobiales bacterium]